MKRKIRKTLARLGYCTRPDFIIIGAQKCGTSGLFKMLEAHSHMAPSLVKEVHYFDNDQWYQKQNIHEYHSFFPFPKDISKGSKVFEATPLYIFHPEVASRLYNYNPKLKLILLLRDPAERAFSAWTMFHHHFKTGKHAHLHDPRPFSTAINKEIQQLENTSYNDNRIAYVKRGIYDTQIKTYLKHFNSDQLLILESKALKTQSSKTLKTVQQFIGVPYEELPYKSQNVSKVSEKELYKDDINALRAFYQPHNERLFELIGETWDWY